MQAASQLTPSSSCSDDPSSARPAGASGWLEGAAGKLSVDAQGGRCQAPGLGGSSGFGPLGPGVSTKTGCTEKGIRRELLGCVERIHVPFPLGPHPVSCSHAFSWCVFNFGGLVSLVREADRSLTFDPQWGMRLGVGVSSSPQAEHNLGRCVARCQVDLGRL